MGGFTHSITLVQLNYFHKLAQTRHFTQAARELFITQPTLSTAVKALENELGVSLVYRDGRRDVRLTRQGEELDARIGPILEELQGALDEVSGAGASHGRALNVGTIPTIQYDFLPSVLRGYWDALGYDRTVHITVEFTNKLVKGLKEQVYDVVFCSRVPEEAGIEFVPLLAKPLVAVVPKESACAKLESLELSRLERIPFATYRETAPIGREVRALLDSSGKHLEPAIAFDDEFSLAGYVVANGDVMGLMLDTFEIGPFRDEVKVIPIQGVGPDWHPICMAWDKNLLKPPELEALISIARANAQE